MKSLILVIFLISELISGQSHRELIEGINSPQQILFRDINHVIFVKDEHLFEMDILERKVKEIGQRKANDFVGLDNSGEIILCSIEHLVINSEDEFSTIFRIKEKELKFFPTIRPIYLKGDTLIATTALDFLEQHLYQISVSSGELKEIEPEVKQNTKELYIEQDLFGNLYLNYNIKEIVFTRISRHLSDLVSQLSELDIFQTLDL